MTFWGDNQLNDAKIAIYKKYQKVKNHLGFPVGDIMQMPYGWWKHRYENGEIFFSEVIGTFAVHGEIYRLYGSMQAEKGFFSYPMTDVIAALDKEGKFCHFENGSIYWHPSSGAHEVHGDIRAKWARLGWENGFLGYPLTDETVTSDKAGRYNHFQGGSIYWTPQTGACSVLMQIRAKWAELKCESGPLGYPVADTTGTPAKSLGNDFQNGRVIWTPPSNYVVEYHT